jgi:hypothetical protein
MNAAMPPAEEVAAIAIAAVVRQAGHIRFLHLMSFIR